MGGALEAIDSDFTDLQLAVRDSKFMLVLTLISQRVNLNAKSHFGRTAAMSIRKNDYSPKIYQLMTLEEGSNFICVCSLQLQTDLLSHKNVYYKTQLFVNNSCFIRYGSQSIVFFRH